jgi:hypothetical protein
MVAVMVENSNLILINSESSIISNVADSITNISPYKPLMVDAATHVIADFPVIHLDKSLVDSHNGKWEPLIEYTAYDIYSVYSSSD